MSSTTSTPNTGAPAAKAPASAAALAGVRFLRSFDGLEPSAGILAASDSFIHPPRCGERTLRRKMQVSAGLGILRFGEAQRLGGQLLGAETARQEAFADFINS